MSFFHTSRCRITSTTVIQGSTPNVASSSQSFLVGYNVTLDPGLWLISGYFTAKFTIIQDGQLVANHIWQGYTPTSLPGRPSSTSVPSVSLFMNLFWGQAGWATNGRKGVFLFQPSMQFQMWGAGGVRIPGEFANAEEHHYFLVD
jgi:hypothetical protein